MFKTLFSTLLLLNFSFADKIDCYTDVFHLLTRQKLKGISLEQAKKISKKYFKNNILAELEAYHILLSINDRVFIRAQFHPEWLLRLTEEEKKDCYPLIEKGSKDIGLEKFFENWAAEYQRINGYGSIHELWKNENVKKKFFESLRKNMASPPVVEIVEIPPERPVVEVARKSKPGRTLFKLDEKIVERLNANKLAPYPLAMAFDVKNEMATLKDFRAKIKKIETPNEAMLVFYMKAKEASEHSKYRGKLTFTADNNQELLIQMTCYLAKKNGFTHETFPGLTEADENSPWYLGSEIKFLSSQKIDSLNDMVRKRLRDQ